MLHPICIIAFCGFLLTQLHELLSSERADLLATLPHSYVSSATFNWNGNRILTCSIENTTRLWNVTDPKSSEFATLLSTLGAIHIFNEVSSCTFSADGTQILTIDLGNAVLWNTRAVESGQTTTPLAVLTHVDNNGSKHRVKLVTFSPDGALILTSTANATSLWDTVEVMKSAKPTPIITLHHPDVFHNTFSPDSRLFLSGYNDKTARLWDVAALKSHKTSAPWRPPPHTILRHIGSVEHTTFSADGRMCLTSSWGFTAKLWSTAALRSGKTDIPLAILKHRGWVSHGTFSPDDTKVLTSSADGTAMLVDITAQKQLAAQLSEYLQPDETPGSDSESAILSAQYVQLLQDTALESATESLAILKHASGVRHGTFSYPNGNQILTSSADGLVRLWNTAALISGEPAVPTATMRHNSTVISSAFSPNQTFPMVLTNSADGTVRLWAIPGEHSEAENAGVVAE